MPITTKFWTREELIRKVERDLDLEEEDFIQPEEMNGYIEEAIDETEKMVHTLYEDYFITKAGLTLVAGTDEYPLPDDIFAQKIRSIIYRNGTRSYTVERIKNWRKFQEYTEARIASSGSTEELKYFVMNSVAGAPVILFSPVPAEDGAFVTVWYLRQANRLDVDADKLDIPEASSFIMQFVKVRCYEKEGHPNLSKAMGDLEAFRSNLETTLADMVPDAENEIEADLSIYGEMN